MSATIRKELEFPAPPEGWEIDRYGLPAMGEKYHSGGEWWDVKVTDTFNPCYLVARKKQSPAEWANAQPRFQALAQIFRTRVEVRVKYSADDVWVFDAYMMQRQMVHLGAPPSGMAAISLKLVNGKWEDTP